MINLATRTDLSLDNYADLLSLAGVGDVSAVCAACGPDSPPLPAEALWLGHDAARDESGGASLLCVRHAADWAEHGHVALAA